MTPFFEQEDKEAELLGDPIWDREQEWDFFFKSWIDTNHSLRVENRTATQAKLQNHSMVYTWAILSTE